MNNPIKFTRKQYLDNKCTHRQYYAQFVTPNIRTLVLSRFSKNILGAKLQEDAHLNNIPLKEWDSMAAYASASFREYGDSPTLAGCVCILKEAAKQIIES